jgi:hypothetical protein
MKEQDPGVKWFNTDFYPHHKTARAARYEQGVLPRLRQESVALFTPWGPRYSWESRGIAIQPNHKEVEALHFLAVLLEEWKRMMPNKTFRWMFLGADLYGTRVNALPADVSAGYFSSVREWLARLLPEAEFRLWSEFDEAAEAYRIQVRERFATLVDWKLLHRATETAHAMGGNCSPNDYLIERFAEAMLIEQTLHPIKISCVGRYKDDKVDWELPRLYFLPESLRAPWL